MNFRLILLLCGSGRFGMFLAPQAWQLIAVKALLFIMRSMKTWLSRG
jgi:tRNA/tmRNA/rRNA uracil-C5-methylase (TrmA/RlmC/RlmD family)